MDDLHLDMCSNLGGSVPVSGLAVPTFLVRILPRHTVQMISGGRVSGLAKKDGDFLSRGRFQGHRNFGTVDRAVEPLFSNDLLCLLVTSQPHENRLPKLVVARREVHDKLGDVVTDRQIRNVIEPRQFLLPGWLNGSVRSKRQSNYMGLLTRWCH